MSCHDALSKPRETTPPGVSILLVSAVALIDPRGMVLITQRPLHKDMGGLWEFPGGKIDEGETPEFALMRELYEELGIETRTSCFTPLNFTSHSYEKFHLLMPLYACRMWQGVPRAKEGQKLAWVKPQDLQEYPMPPADLPLCFAIQDYLQ